MNEQNQEAPPVPLAGGKGRGESPSLCLCGCGTSLAGRKNGIQYVDANHRRRAARMAARATAPIRTCLHCGEVLQHRNAGGKYCNQKCKDAARKRTRPFVALDGEGENNRDGIHVYTLLASSSGKAIGSKQGLGTEQCLDFLLSLPRGSESGARPIYVWFAFDYDVNMMLGDIPLPLIETLKKENTIYWRGYKIMYLRRKIFRVSYAGRVHTSYDVWGFFQASFETALKAWHIDVPEIIKVGKAARGDFAKWSLKKIREYNDAELVLLAELCEKLREAIAPLKLPIQSWHGPAALAAAWLRKNKVTEWMAEIDSPTLLEIAARAYFGGRIDVLGYGIVNPVWHYDIVSAYPSSIAKLPNLAKLTWKRHGKGQPQAGGLYVARIKWEIPATYWAPFPWRSRNGTIRYPLEGEGWYWFPEVEMAIAKYGKKNIRVMESWVAEGELEYPFHDLIHSTFQYRKELKAKGHASHIAVKLILNSLYGKFAQTVGKATYYSPIWAGLITSHTRAQLMEVLSNDVVCVMTDSIWSREPLTVPIGEELGEWEKQDETRLVLAEAGLYSATSPNGSVSTWQRGFDKRNPVDIEELVRHWISDDPLFTPTYNVLRFVGMGLATATNYPWRQWVEISRKIEPVPFAGTTKRMPYEIAPTIGKIESDVGRKFFELHLRWRDTDEISAPYSKLTENAKLLQERLEDECDDDND